MQGDARNDLVAALGSAMQGDALAAIMHTLDIGSLLAHPDFFGLQTARVPSTGWLASARRRHRAPLCAAHRRYRNTEGWPWTNRMQVELVGVPTPEHFVSRVVPCTRWLATSSTHCRNSVLKSIQARRGSRPNKPHTKFHRTYFTPGLDSPLVCARYGQHRRGRKPQYRAKSRNTGFQTISPRWSLPNHTVFIRSYRISSGTDPHSPKAASCIRRSVPSF